MNKHTIFIFWMLFLVVRSSWAQDLDSDADRYYQANEWEKTLKAYSELVKQDPANPQNWFRLGRALHETGNYKEALRAYDEADKRGVHKLSVLLQKARSFARLGNSKQAMDHFKQAVDLGFNQPSVMTDDNELAVLRKDSRYDSVLSQIKRNERPCSFELEFRNFDFWIGDWEVFVSGGLAGRSHVELILRDCVIVENWDSTSYGYSGKSYNVYHPGLKKWQQFWVDDAAGPTLYTGEFINGEMRFDAEKMNADGTKALTKMTFYNLGPDKVRQWIRQSTDGGKTWSDVFDGEYRRVNKR